MGNHSGASYRADGWNCHCFYNNDAMPTGAPFIGTLGVSYGVRRCWIRCGCWTVPYGHGGQGAITSYCGSGHCGQGGQVEEDSLRSLTSKPNKKILQRGL